MLLLRISGRKSIAQMTLAQTIVMISIGTIIVQPIVEKSVVKAIAGAGIFVVTIWLMEYLQLKFNLIEKAISGKSKVVVENGKLNLKNLKKLRLTVDQLEMRMRNHGITRIADLKTATLEPNGLIGYEWKEDAKPLTVGDFRKMMEMYFPYQQGMGHNTGKITTEGNSNIFEEIDDPHAQNHKDFLQ